MDLRPVQAGCAAETGKKVEGGIVRILPSVLKTDVESALFGQKECAPGVGENMIEILLHRENADCVAPERGQIPDRQRVPVCPELTEGFRNRFLPHVRREESQFAFPRAPFVGREGKVRLLKGTPPEKVFRAVRPGVEHRIADEVRLLLFGAVRRGNGADLFHRAGSASDVGIQKRLHRRLKHAADRRVLVHARRRLRGRMRIRMRRQQIAELPLRLNRPDRRIPRQSFPRGERVHPRSDRSGRILHPDGGGNRIGPVPRVGRFRHDAHAVAFVAQLPAADRRALLQLPDKAADKFHLPLDGKRIGQRIEFLQRRRKKERSAHPAGHDPDNELQMVLLRDGGKCPETADHGLVDSGASARRVGKILPVHPDCADPATIAGKQFDRLEIPPVRKNPQQFASESPETGQIVPDNLFIPQFPHPGPRMGGPVVASDLHSGQILSCLLFLYEIIL